MDNEFVEALARWLQLYDRKDVKSALRLRDVCMIELIDEVAEEEDSEETYTFNFAVDSESLKNKIYMVDVSFSKTFIKTNCDCAASKNSLHCKHVAACLMAILDTTANLHDETIEALALGKLKPKHISESVHDKEYKEASPQRQPTPARVIPLFNEPGAEAPWHSFKMQPDRALDFVRRISGYMRIHPQSFKKLNLQSGDKQATHWIFRFEAEKGKLYYPEIRYDRDSLFNHRCTCNIDALMCEHVRLAFEWLEFMNGHDCFLKLKDWSKEKAKLLEAYGLTLEDKEASDIEFTTNYAGELQMSVPAWLWKKDAASDISAFKKTVSGKESGSVTERQKSLKDTIIDFKVGFLFNFVSQHFKNGFELEVIKVFHKPSGRQVKKLSIHNPQNLPLLAELPDEVFELLSGLTDEGVKKYLQDAGHGYIRNYSNPWVYLTGSTFELFQHYYLQQLKKLWPFLSSHPEVYLLQDGNFSNTNVKPVRLSPDGLTLGYIVEEDERFITIRQQYVINGQPLNLKNTILYRLGIISIDEVFYLPADLDDIPLIWQFRHGFIKIPVSNKLSVISGMIPALQKKHTVELPPSLQLKVVEVEPKPQVLLKEYKTQYLMLQPQFVYNDVTVDYETDPQEVVQTLPDNSFQLIKRNGAKEKSFFQQLQGLHGTFNQQTQNNFFFLPFDDVMRKNWFLNTVRNLQAIEIPVLGMQELKRFRYNTAQPKWEMKAGSGVDWFDLQIKVSFGDQQVPLKQIKQALASKQNVVMLGDGTIGVLPEEWLQQFGLILKIGNEHKEGTIRLNKLHYTLIDELHNQIDDDKLLAEIEEKKKKLQGIETIKSASVSKAITASLRAYQQSGFQWLQVLDQLGWGGCLADDMGLGKTLQAIAFLQYIKEKYRGSTNLVVCPTSLIYNWESELKKFAPSLKWHIYYGSSREFSEEHFEDYDLVITSYGLVRNDLQELLKFEWHYVILDESQAIKNPDALTTKAVQLLKSKNRLIMSGTPVQNNTFDLYAQFHFINPGLLGTREFYKEFTNGIDKNNDPEKAAQLRKMVYPFMLRRTKEQVAKDLPDKTEIIVWCEMDKEQRAVYEDYKNYYRTTLIKKIDELGMGGAGMYILEGLLRLRQICDSPQLLKSDEVKTESSVKIDELMREIEENTGQHKLLVFSQFTEMLQLIKKRIEKAGWKYAYLDGSTTARNRKKAVDEFQNDPALKIFLISLKAGGVGLNLTAADYIYLVDPWWNPAVEQQAIDRTHRIGQTNKVFAYKMICKNTVEEKIVELQQRKKQLANELVTEDSGFVKKLSKEDVEFLLS